MKRIFALLLAFTLLFCLAACKDDSLNKPTLSEEELDKLLQEIIDRDKVNLDDYSPEQQEQIKDKLEDDGFGIEDDGSLTVKDPVPPETLDQIVDDALNKGEVDLGDFNPAQQEQIKDKLEDEGLTTEKPEEGETVVPVKPIPELTEQEVTDFFANIGIMDDFVPVAGFAVKVDLSSYPKPQQEQIIRAAGILGLEYQEKDDGFYFVASEIHLDNVPDNPNE